MLLPRWLLQSDWVYWQCWNSSVNHMGWCRQHLDPSRVEIDNIVKFPYSWNKLPHFNYQMIIIKLVQIELYYSVLITQLFFTFWNRGSQWFYHHRWAIRYRRYEPKTCSCIAVLAHFHINFSILFNFSI